MNNTIKIAAIMWGVIAFCVVLVLLYLDCQHTQDRILDCVKGGRGPEECHKAFQ